jgi:hypothetical protein
VSTGVLTSVYVYRVCLLAYLSVNVEHTNKLLYIGTVYFQMVCTVPCYCCWWHKDITCMSHFRGDDCHKFKVNTRVLASMCLYLPVVCRRGVDKLEGWGGPKWDAQLIFWTTELCFVRSTNFKFFSKTQENSMNTRDFLNLQFLLVPGVRTRRYATDLRYVCWDITEVPLGYKQVALSHQIRFCTD